MTPPYAFLSTGHPAADAVERGFALLCLGLLAGGAWALAASGATAPDWPRLLGVVSAVTLVCTPVCVWMTNRMEDVPVRSFRGTGANWLALLQDWLVPGSMARQRLDRSGATEAGLRLAVEAMAGGDAHLSAEIERGLTGIETAARTLDQIVIHAEGVAGTIRGTTQDLAAMRQNAGGLADAAYAAQASLRGLLAKTAPLGDMADQLHGELHAMRRRAEALAAQRPDFGADLPADGQAIPEAAAVAMVRVDTMLSALSAQASASEAMVAQVEHLASLILDQHRAGDAMAGSILSQGAAVSALLRTIDALRPALDAAQESSERAGAIEAARRRAATAVWQDVSAVPSRAATVALLLRGLPIAQARQDLMSD